MKTNLIKTAVLSVMLLASRGCGDTAPALHEGGIKLEQASAETDDTYYDAAFVTEAETSTEMTTAAEVAYTAPESGVRFLVPDEADFALLERELRDHPISMGDFDYRNVYMPSSGEYNYDMLLEYAVHAAEQNYYEGYNGNARSLRKENGGHETITVPILGETDDFMYILDSEAVDGIFRDKYNMRPDHEHLNKEVRQVFDNWGTWRQCELLYDDGLYYESIIISYESETTERGTLVSTAEVGSGLYTVQMLGEEQTYYLVALKDIDGRRVWSYYAKSSEPIDTSDLPPTDIAYRDTTPSDPLPASVQAIKDANFGDHVTYGKYQWMITDKQDGFAKLFCDSIVDHQPFNTSYTKQTWMSCSLRQLLNGAFINNTFTEEEARYLADTKCYTRFEPTVTDKVFLPTAFDTTMGTTIGERWLERWVTGQGLDILCCEYGDGENTARIDETVGIRPVICVKFTQ